MTPEAQEGIPSSLLGSQISQTWELPRDQQAIRSQNQQLHPYYTFMECCASNDWPAIQWCLQQLFTSVLCYPMSARELMMGTTPWFSARGLVTKPLLLHNYQPEDWWQNLYYPTIISQRTGDRTFTTYPTTISQRTDDRTITTPQLSARGLVTEPLLPYNYQPED